MPIHVQTISESEFRKRQERRKLKGPGPVKMLKHVSAAAARALVAKNRFAPPEMVKYRMGICLKCKFWHDDARFGLGKCTHQACGCTRLKQKLLTESCPEGKW